MVSLLGVPAAIGPARQLFPPAPQEKQKQPKEQKKKKNKIGNKKKERVNGTFRLPKTGNFFTKLPLRISFT